MYKGGGLEAKNWCRSESMSGLSTQTGSRWRHEPSLSWWQLHQGIAWGECRGALGVGFIVQAGESGAPRAGIGAGIINKKKKKRKTKLSTF